jgi:hypothetical protein
MQYDKHAHVYINMFIVKIFNDFITKILEIALNDTKFVVQNKAVRKFGRFRSFFFQP